MDESAAEGLDPAIDHSQCKAIGPAVLEILNVHLVVWCCFPLTPEQKAITSGKALLCDAGNLETKNKSPDLVSAVSLLLPTMPRMSFRLPSTISSGPAVSSLAIAPTNVSEFHTAVANELKRL